MSKGLQFEDIEFRYRRGSPPIFKRFSFDTGEGRCVLLGPNGAGKSTLLGIGANALTPNSGSVRLDGRTPRGHRQTSAYRAAVGWMPQAVRAIPGLTAREQVAYAGWLKGMSRTEAWAAAGPALASVQLNELEGQTVTSLSGGQLRRVGLAQVLVHRPRVMLLDEPTAGLDPAQRSQFRLILRSLAPDVSFLISTHQVDDLNMAFERVAVLSGGRIAFEGDIEQFLNLAPRDSKHPGEDAYLRLIGGGEH